MKLLSKKQVLELVPYRVSHLGGQEKKGLLPERVKDTRFTEHRPSYAKAFWVVQEILDWINDLIAKQLSAFTLLCRGQAEGRVPRLRFFYLFNRDRRVLASMVVSRTKLRTSPQIILDPFDEF